METQWTEKDKRKFKHVLESLLDKNIAKSKAKDIAAKKVNKDRRIAGKTQNESTLGTGNPNLMLKEHSKRELYNIAKEKNIRGRSKMSKNELIDEIKYKLLETKSISELKTIYKQWKNQKFDNSRYEKMLSLVRISILVDCDLDSDLIKEIKFYEPRYHELLEKLSLRREKLLRTLNTLDTQLRSEAQLKSLAEDTISLYKEVIQFIVEVNYREVGTLD